MASPDRHARIAQLRAQIEALQQELARLEAEEDAQGGPYQQYVERARAAGQTPVPQPEFERYLTAHAQLEQEWIRLGRPSQGWPRMQVLIRVRGLLALPAINGVEPTPTAVSAPSGPVRTAPAPTPPSPSSAMGGSRTPAPAPPPSTRYVPPTVSREQLVEMHNPILNEIMELNKRAVEEFKLAKISDGIISSERSIYLLERVIHAPPAMGNALIKVANDAMKAAGVPEADRARLATVVERATSVVKAASGH